MDISSCGDNAFAFPSPRLTDASNVGDDRANPPNFTDWLHVRVATRDSVKRVAHGRMMSEQLHSNFTPLCKDTNRLTWLWNTIDVECLM